MLAGHCHIGLSVVLHRHQQKFAIQLASPDCEGGASSSIAGVSSFRELTIGSSGASLRVSIEPFASSEAPTSQAFCRNSEKGHPSHFLGSPFPPPQCARLRPRCCWAPIFLPAGRRQRLDSAGTASTQVAQAVVRQPAAEAAGTEGEAVEQRITNLQMALKIAPNEEPQ